VLPPDHHNHPSNHYDSQGHYKNLESFTLLGDNDDLIDLFVHLPLLENVPFVLDYQLIAQAQIGDAQLQQLHNSTPAKFQQQLLAPNISIWCHTVDHNQQGKIYLPDALLEQAIRWYHLALSHIGTHRLTDTMSETFYNPKLCLNVEAVLKPCEHRQKYKNVQRGHGKTAPREAGLLPWSEVAVDMIGPWTLEVSDRKEKFSALTIIDLVTNLVETVHVNSKTTAAITAHFVSTWLACYPKPMSCVHDPGLEFIGWNFQEMLHRNNIQSRCTTTKNPQATAICEQMHQSVGNSLRVLQQWNPPAGLNDAHALVDTALANAMYATRASYHSGIQTTPGALAFHCDMVTDIPMMSDLRLVQQNRQ
jgi:Integrase zinc binding domain